MHTKREFSCGFCDDTNVTYTPCSSRGAVAVKHTCAHTIAAATASATAAAAGSGGQASAAAAATVRLTSKVSYLRLLTALVTRAPTSSDATVRARILLAALVKAITNGAAVVVGAGAGAGAGVGVRARSAASDSTILCMQTLRFLVGWGEASDGSSGKGMHRGDQALFATSATAAGGFEGGVGEAPICLHGLRARPSPDDSGAAAAAVAGGNPTGPSTVCFVCPLEDRARRCDFVQVTRQVGEREEKARLLHESTCFF